MLRLKKIIDTAGARIVLSSAWRSTPSGCDEVKQVLKSYGIACFFDKTPQFRNPYDRHQEISLWIKNNKFEGDWIAIDDLPMPQLGAHFVQTNPTTGLVDSDVAKAVMQLSSR